MGGLISGAIAILAEQSTGRGARGVVLAAAPQAAAIGAEALRQGGNAFDAVVSAALAECVLLPPKCGLGGDVVSIALKAGDLEPLALLAIGGAPRRLAEAARQGKLTTTGPLSVGVPGAPAGYDLLASSGVLGRHRLAAPALELGRGGFAWSQICTALGVESRDLVREHNSGGTSYFPAGNVIEAGTLVRLPKLADLIEEWADRGGELFWGSAGEVVSQSVTQRGGVIEVEDFRRVRAEWESPASGTTDGRRLWATPAPTHGPSLIEAMSEAKPGDGSGAVWDRVCDSIDQRTLRLGDIGTSMVSAADHAGNIVVVIHSNSFPRYGSGLVVNEFELILNNRPGRGFSSQPGHPNYPAEGKRPATTLHAWALSDQGGTPRYFGGTPGGENQMTWNAQTLQQIIDGDDNPGKLVVAPRWEILADGSLAVEEGFTAEDMQTLKRRVGRLMEVPQWDLHCAQQVILRPKEGSAIVGAVDPRTGGAAVAV